MLLLVLCKVENTNILEGFSNDRICKISTTAYIQRLDPRLTSLVVQTECVGLAS
jgi:hypothetical protein